MYVKYFMALLCILIIIMVSYELWKYVLPAWREYRESFKKPVYKIYRALDNGTNKTYMGEERGRTPREALNRFARRRGFADYCDMVHINMYPGMKYVAIEEE